MMEPVTAALAAMQERLWTEYGTEAAFPPGLPDEVRLDMLERAYQEIRCAPGGPPSFRYLSLFPGMHPVLDFCTGWCPRCSLLRWCPAVAGTYRPEEVEWMREHNAYPPPF